MKQTVKHYYESKLGTVRDSDIKDVFELAANLRQADKEEIWKSNHKTPETALLDGYTNSIICFTIERNEKAIAMFGIVPHTILGSVATIWLLGSPELEKVQRAFLKYSKYFIDIMLSYYPILINYVDVVNIQSIKWLKWCGAEFGPTVPYGIENQLFQYFQFRRR